MRKNVFLAVFAVIVLGIIVAGVGLPYLHQAAPGTDAIGIPSTPNIIGSSGPYVLAAPFPDVNDSYPVYRTVLPDTSTEEKRRIGDLFGVSEGVEKPERTDGRLYYYTNSGAFQYIIPAKAYPYATDRQPDLPSDEEARAIATTYLKERGLFPADVYFEYVKIGSSCENRSPTSVTVYNLTKHVHFIKKIQDLRVHTAGITVSIGENGEVVAVSNSLREFDPKPVRDVKIITPEQAYQRLSAGDVMIQPLQEDYDKIVVTNISLGYWMETQTEPQEYIVPVYVFSCNAMWDGKSEEVFRYVPAVDPTEMEGLT
ncbi:hypothetical protein FGU65_01275 [Methanoculleus sp. FWC-SCC1]|uniref:FTP domain-containing protein n=1 Tax=Methanoculleus frigidifontis TaxID=2584085 RepID=A0ABT8M6I6_9EURY|nr:hypothetical protein [Methanoculleus sp. FWC-SCC1]MDN7023543.1 hypothetical protein [Methanoculleus sp. FWC-SCC1]